MISEHFFSWARTVTAGERAEGAASLARDYLYMELTVEERREVEDILTILLEDPSVLVRRALAESLAGAFDAPHHIILELANDQAEVAAIVLGRSPLFTAADLVDCVSLGRPAIQIAIAERPDLAASVACEIARQGCLAALVALARNHGADLQADAMKQMIARFGHDGSLRDALLGRPFVPPAVRVDLAIATGEALVGFAAKAGWLSAEQGERSAREAREKVTVTVACDAIDTSTVAGESPRTAALDFVRHLRVSGLLTPGLLLRALLSADRWLFEAAMTELSGLPFSKAAALVGNWKSQGFVALYGRAGLPGWLLPAFQAALAAQVDVAVSCDREGEAHLHRRLVDRVLAACAGMTTPEAGKLMVLLRRFQAEAARDAVRDMLPDVRELLPEVRDVLPEVRHTFPAFVELELRPTIHPAAAEPVAAVSGSVLDFRPGFDGQRIAA